MAQVLVNESSLEDIGDAIREKNASSDTYLPSEMGNAIRAIRTGGDVTSVNGKTGAVVLSASDVGAGTYSKPSGGIPKSDLASAVQTSLGKADTALQTAPVTSVNENTGDITITPANIGAKAVQSAVSDPSASGTAIAFINTISQNAQGVITATKKTVREATTSLSGLMSSADKGNLNAAVTAKNLFIMLRDELSYPIVKNSVVIRYVASKYGLYRAKKTISSEADDVEASWEYLSSNTYKSGYLSEIVEYIAIAHNSLATDEQDLVYPLLPYTITHDKYGNMYQLGSSGADDASSAFWTIVPNLGYCVSENRRRIESVGNNASKALSMAQGLTDSLAPYYSSGLFPITAGQMVMYGSTNAKRLYRALVDIPTAEDFTAAHWEQVTVDELINALEDVALGAYPTANTSGPVAAFTDGADDVPVKALEIDIESQTGVTGATLTRCGRNLIYWPALDMTSQNDVTAQITPNGTLSLSGTATGTVSGLYDGGKASDYSTMHLGPFPAGTYTITARGFVGASADDYILVSAKYADNSDVRNSFRISAAGGATPTGEGLPVTFTATDSFKLFIYIRIASGTTMNCEVELQMEPGSALGTWEPYNSTTYTVNWSAEPGAITSGTLDVINGVLNTGGQDYDVTPIDVQTMLGNNTFYADCGDVSVTYRADIGLYINRKIAEANA